MGEADLNHDCEHSHEHNHSHAHDHGHEHGHDHSHHHHGSEHGIFHISHHEEALIGSVHGRLYCKDFDKAREILLEKAHQIQDEIGQSGGIVGHINFIINSPEHCCQISLTGAGENTRYFDMDSCSVEGAVIVFLVAEDALKHILQENLGTVLTEWNA